MLLHPDLGTVHMAKVAVEFDEIIIGLLALFASLLSHEREASREMRFETPSFDQEDWYDSNSAEH